MVNRSSCTTFSIRLYENKAGSWSGVVCWVEKDIIGEFNSALELLKFMDWADRFHLHATSEEEQVV